MYNHQIFQHAARVFEALKHERPDPRRPRGSPTRRPAHEDSAPTPREIPNIEFDSENEKRLTFQLVFRTLKCEFLREPE